VKLADDSDPDKLIAVGAAILVAGIAADNVNLWLKQVGSRPRYKYLITLDDPISEYRSWWQMVPNLAGSNDNFKSWPSGNMTIASMMFSLPMLTDVLKNRSAKRNGIAFALACIFVLLYGYNRIHMTNHFLTDVCFGTLITYLLYAGISTAFLHSAERQ
jgi:membrane-associated phospholipid phosphatase